MILWFANVNYLFGSNAFFPYTAGRLWAYAKQEIPGLELGELLWRREPVQDVLSRMERRPPDVLALSLYVWSEQYSRMLALAVRDRFPDSLIIVGGPQVPERGAVEWLCNEPYDVSISGEGEQTFVQILRESDRYVGGKHAIAGVRLNDLSVLPSPYLSGVFDDLVRDQSIQWQALQETNRGCPYSCTFCDWGSATYSKVRKFPIEQCVAELEWLARNRIELLYNCDANFGMLEQDDQFTDALVRVSRGGYPSKFRAAYAKKINDRVFGVAKKISDAGLSKGATISFQSMDKTVLKNVKRLNPVQTTLSETFAKYRAAGIPTYTELIVGLPGETLSTFISGIDELLDAGQHYGLNVYPCMALRNSELTHQGVKTKRVHLLLLHGDASNDPSPEMYDLVIETDTMNHAEWRRAWILSIVIQGLHCGGMTDQLAIRARSVVRYTEFYQRLIDRATSSPVDFPILYWAIRNIHAAIDRALHGMPWDTSIRGFGNVQWPLEEAFRLLCSSYRIWAEIESATIDLGLSSSDIYDQSISTSLPTDAQWNGDVEKWAREVIWYGRKGGVTKEEVSI